MLRWLTLLVIFWQAAFVGFDLSYARSFHSNSVNSNPSLPADALKYVWWMVNWETNSITCSVTVYHSGIPTIVELQKGCGNTYTQQWLSTPPCPTNLNCRGYYIHLASTSTVLPTSDSQNSSSVTDISLVLGLANQSKPFNSFTNQTTPNPVDACAVIWQSQPPDERPTWLSTPERSDYLATNEALYYLAGRLIAHNIVDASACPSGGLRNSQYANECGMEVARPVVQYWQNQFDPEIFQSAQVAGIPAVLLKRIFIQESQLWPETNQINKETGIGQATELGLDALFFYDPEFYKSFCPQMLSKKACEVNYYRQSQENKELLRGALTYQLNANCDDCQLGVDVQKTKDSIPIFADLIVANCKQVSQIFINATGYLPGALAPYEDLWRFTLANYHVGSGCLSYPIYKAWKDTRTVNTEEVSNYFTQPCASVFPYVTNVTR